jgi:hypothetical protein
LRGKVCQPAESPAKFEQRHARPQLQFAANQVQLVLLSLIESGRVFPISACVLHAAIQHGLIKLVAEIVVRLRDLLRALHRLQVENARLQDEQSSPQVVNIAGQVSPPESGEELVQRLDVPPSVHIRFAHADAAFTQGAVKKPLVVNLDVPGLGPIHADPGKT